MTDTVDASSANPGDSENVLFIHADIFRAPFKREFFDFAYSVGVLHHTSDPNKAFETMAGVVRDNGDVAVSLYDISQYHRPNRNLLKVATLEVLWALTMWRCELFRQIAIRGPHNLMILYCKTVIPVLYLLNKTPVIGLVKYLLPSTCSKKLPMMVDTTNVYSTEIVHQYQAHKKHNRLANRPLLAPFITQRLAP